MTSHSIEVKETEAAPYLGLFMRIAFIDHSYHKDTKSTGFFLDMISGAGEVELFYDETWCHGDNGWWDTFEEAAYHLIIVWQVHEAFSKLSGEHKNVVFVPMYDGMISDGKFYWKKKFSAAKCVSFCRQLHQEITYHGGVSEYFQFFPNPSEYSVVRDFEELRGYFWYRTTDIDLRRILDLCQESEIRSLTIHNAPDPFQEALCVPKVRGPVEELKVTRWYKTRDDYKRALTQHNVFFAPRRLEGIGMSFLEAMATGMCVVAANSPTMNEYISNGTNGLLYSTERSFPLNFTKAQEMGARARERVERGFATWERDKQRLLDYILPGSSKISTIGSHLVPERTEATARHNLVVVTVCRNAELDLEKTIQSVLGQDYGNFDYAIFDGASTDATVEIIKKYADRLSFWQSEPDEGVYHAMNMAAEKSQGDWVLFMNAGDTFAGRDALSRMFANVPDDADVVYGHHFYVPLDGATQYHPAADFRLTWDRLQKGHLWFDWLAGMPGHQATAVRRTLLQRLKFNTKFRIAADHDLLFRAYRDGAQFFNTDELVSTYVGGGFSAKNYELCRREWRQIARAHGDQKTADEFYDIMDGQFVGDGETDGSIAEKSDVVVVGPNDIAAQCFILQGFGKLEGPYKDHNLPKFRWALGPVAKIEFRDENYPRIVRLRMAAFLKHQAVQIFADSTRVGAIRIPEIKRENGTFVEYIVDLKKYAGAKVLTLKFNNWADDARRPIAVMVSAIDAD